MSGNDQTRQVFAVSGACGDTLHYLRSPAFWLITVSACLVTGFGGPFGTGELLPLFQRLIYWSAILGFSILCLTYLSFVALRLVVAWGWHWLAGPILAGLVGTPLVMACIAVLRRVFLPEGPALDFGLLAFEVGVPSVLVSVLASAFSRTPPGLPDPRAPGQTPTEATPSPPPPHEASAVFELVPPEIGRDIVSIRADDHYIEIRTPQGQARILMRLRDAEAALAALPGLRVHRSWWLNLDHVTALEVKSGGSGVVTLDTGETVPVSRGQVAAVGAALQSRPLATRI